jgi:hypothetical protein
MLINLSVFSLRTRIPPATLVGKLMWAYKVAGQLLVEHFQYTLSPHQSNLPTQFRIFCILTKNILTK